MCQAQYSNHQLYQAYITRDMSVWQQYIDSADWENLDTEQRKQLLNYEYGYSAYILGINVEEGKQCIQRFASHLEMMKSELPEERYCAYMASVQSYRLALDKSQLMKYAKRVFSNIQRAMEINPNDPFVLSMQGNVEFYSPFGSKKEALVYYQKADSLYGVAGTDYERWNRRAVQMTYILCLHKLRREDEAKKLCEELLAEEPNNVNFQQLLKNLNATN
jgi:predicted Zn-dependent protease